MADDLVKLKEQVYVDPRPAEAFDRYHARTREKEPGPAYEVVRGLTTLLAATFYRGRAYGTERVPASGPLVIAPNHFSNLDHFFMGMGIRRKIHFMAKSQMFVSPIDKVYANGGTFPVRRGAGDAAAFETVHAILDRGGALGMYCEGGRSRTGKLAERAKPGIGRIALESGATILPTAIHGSSHVRNVKRGQFPRITVLFGAPLRYERLGPGNVGRDDARIVANEIFDEIKALYAVVEAGGRDAARAWRPAA
ncbi:lysophospholipid acyltransferase family protein [Patulibacter sp. SYSU D01012]|uniref:lysophospholipid acyltransferase family protein n=1 Tax=Patulibacter sp. SYSU D01012 TaxID=2817381 RepID=UPI001B317DA5|nr:lysophospholipid acyltransferase family protein [Patulibacter sp. SYSU D01012]